MTACGVEAVTLETERQESVNGLRVLLVDDDADFSWGSASRRSTTA